MGDRFDYSDYRLSSPLSAVKPYYDVIVVGSGYGGSIAASRCSRAGKDVCLLEKGKEWWPGDFHEGVGAAKDLQMSYNDAEGKCVHIGKPSNLYDIVVGPDVAVVQGVGLGGTSLINANVCLDADPRVFEDEVWPNALKDDLKGTNNIDRQRFISTMRPEAYPDTYPPLPKLDAMQRIANDFAQDIEDLQPKDIFYKTPLYVNFKTTASNAAGIPQPACNNCGNCVAGCNTGAKATLNMNFLPDAHAHGASIFTEVQVNAVMRQEKSDHWIVFYQDLHQDTFEQKERMVKARTVILGAGSLGSTRILLNSAARGLPLSSKVGQRFTTNGDQVSFSHNGNRKIRPVGIKLESVTSVDQGPGPCITSILDLRRKPGEGVEDGFVLEDGTPPSALETPYKMLMRRSDGEDTTPDEHEFAEFIRSINGKAFDNTLAFLSMSHDSANGRIVRDACTAMVWIDYPGVGDGRNFEAIHEAARKAATSMEGELIANPFWKGLLPHLSGRNGIVSVHPLGGCGMGESGATGVVDHSGAVFQADSAAVYPNLLVVDGAVMPRSVGVNPTLTIGTIAERCVRLLAERNGWTIDYDSATTVATSVKETKKKPGLQFTERMAGHLTVDDEKHACEFTLTIHSDDVQHMIDEDDEHEATLHGTVSCMALSSHPLTVSNGRFRLFRPSKQSKHTREMVYEMHLHDHENEFHFRGLKTVHKDSFLEIGVGDTTTLAVVVRKGHVEGEQAGHGTLTIKISDFLQQLTTLEVTNTKSLFEKTKWIAKFGHFFSGVLLDIYGMFNPSKLGAAFNHEAKPRVHRQLKLRDIKPEVHRLQATDGVQLLLARYHGGSKGPLLLLHGLGVSSRIFTLDTVDTNMVEFLVENDFDVWVLDMRYSIMLPSHKEMGYIGDAAEKDVPPAIDYILERTGCADLEIFAHCAGGVTAHAVLLGGHVDRSKIRCLVSSQAGFSLKVGAINNAKSHAHIPSVLHGLGVSGITAYPDNPASWNQRIVSSVVEKVAELTTKMREHCESDVCHRVTFTYNLLWSHRNVNELTHDTLHEWNGFAHATRLKHFALCMRRGRLINPKGKDIYLPDFHSKHRLKSEEYLAAIKRLDLPILYYHGAKNVCWDPETTLDSLRRCQEVNTNQHYARFEVEGYMHLDCIMGARAVDDVFPKFLPFLNTYAHPK